MGGRLGWLARGVRCARKEQKQLTFTLFAWWRGRGEKHDGQTVHGQPVGPFRGRPIAVAAHFRGNTVHKDYIWDSSKTLLYEQMRHAQCLHHLSVLLEYLSTHR